MSEHTLPDSHGKILFSNRFAGLPEQFYSRLLPTPLPHPYLVAYSPTVAGLLGWDHLQFNQSDMVNLLTGNQLFTDSQPLAAVYSGHQFGVWAGQLGDGRAILLGDVTAPDSAQALEIQLKGSGPTPYSRRGDGRAVLRSSIREFLCSEAMHGLGIPTSRALSVTGSDQRVIRETPETTAIVTRVAASFIRFGSFEHWYYREDVDALKTLADFVLTRYLPQLLDHANPYQALLQEVCHRTAELIAQWQAVGFMHGVMNSDNMSILGITLDYGPFGFMESYDPAHICNHSDQQVRYAYQMQPGIGQWNCHALAQAMLPLIGSVEATQAALRIYPQSFQKKMQQLMQAKLGLQSMQDGDADLIQAYLDLLQQDQADFTLSFRKLGDISSIVSTADDALRDLFINRAALDAWLQTYRARLQQENSDDTARKSRMHAVNPKYILRNYLAQVAIEKAQNKDFSEVQTLLRILENPYAEQPEHAHYAQLPPDWARQLQLSCSS